MRSAHAWLMALFQWLSRSDFVEQQQDEQYHQNHSAEPHAGMAHAVAVAAEPAGHPAEQVDDHENDQDQPKRHGALPLAADVAPRRFSKAYSAPAHQEGRGKALFRFQLQRRRVDAIAQAGRPRSVREDVAEMAG